MPRAASHAARAAIGEEGAARTQRKPTPRAKGSTPSASRDSAPATRPAPARRGTSRSRSAPARRSAPRRKPGAARAATRAGSASTARAARSRATVPARRPSRAPRRAADAVVLRLPVRSANGVLDKLLRGRLWVGLVGALLVGIVFLNVSLLGINGGIAATSEQATELRRQNAELRLDVAKLGASERIQRAAEAQGFVMPAPGDVTYLEPDPESDARRAALALEKGAAAAETAVAPVVPEAATPVTDEAAAPLVPEEVAAAPPAVPTAEPTAVP